MALINFITIIDELSADSFLCVKERINPFLPYYFSDGKNADKELFKEKIGSFF